MARGQRNLVGYQARRLGNQVVLVSPEMAPQFDAAGLPELEVPEILPEAQPAISDQELAAAAIPSIPLESLRRVDAPIVPGIEVGEAVPVEAAPPIPVDPIEQERMRLAAIRAQRRLMARAPAPIEMESVPTEMQSLGSFRTQREAQVAARASGLLNAEIVPAGGQFEVRVPVAPASAPEAGVLAPAAPVSEIPGPATQVGEAEIPPPIEIPPVPVEPTQPIAAEREAVQAARRQQRLAERRPDERVALESLPPAPGELIGTYRTAIAARIQRNAMGRPDAEITSTPTGFELRLPPTPVVMEPARSLETADAVQEPEAAEGVLRQERPEVGLPEVAQEATPEVARPAAETRVLESRPPEVKKPRKVYPPKTADQFRQRYGAKVRGLILKHGVVKREMRDVSGERPGTRAMGFVARSFKERGKEIDWWRQTFQDLGYFPKDGTRDVTGDAEATRELLRSFINGENEVPPFSADWNDYQNFVMRERDEAQRIMEEMRLADQAITPEGLSLQAEAETVLSEDEIESLATRFDNDDDYYAALKEAINAKRATDPVEDSSEGTEPAFELRAEQDGVAPEQQPRALSAAERPENFQLTPQTKSEAVVEDEARRSVTARQRPLLSQGKPLAKIKIRREAIDTDTGRRLRVSERADLALADVDKQITDLRDLIQCLGS